jgi:hypothetical protein
MGMPDARRRHKAKALQALAFFVILGRYAPA